MDRAKSNLEQWRTLQAVVDHGGYAQAANQLNKSQSSLNHAVSKLQLQLGVQLLVVKGRKAYLTESGEVLLRRSRLLTQSVNELELLANNLEQGWEPNISIARDIVYPMEPLINALKEFLPKSRGTRITILDSVITGTQEQIINQQVELAICSGVPPKGHIAQPLCQLDFILVCHPSHELAKVQAIEDDQILAQHLQIVIKDTGIKPDDKFGWLKAEQRWTVSNFHEARNILLQGMGFCWIPAYIIQEDIELGKLTRLTLKGGDHRKVLMSLVIPNRDRQGPASKLLETLIVEQHINNKYF